MKEHDVNYVEVEPGESMTFDDLVQAMEIKFEKKIHIATLALRICATIFTIDKEGVKKDFEEYPTNETIEDMAHRIAKRCPRPEHGRIKIFLQSLGETIVTDYITYYNY